EPAHRRGLGAAHDLPRNARRARRHDPRPAGADLRARRRVGRLHRRGPGLPRRAVQRHRPDPPRALGRERHEGLARGAARPPAARRAQDLPALSAGRRHGPNDRGLDRVDSSLGARHHRSFHPMRIHLISPTHYLPDGSLAKTTRYWTSGITLPYLKALTPSRHQVTFTDELMHDLDIARVEREADVVGLTAMG